MTQIRNLGLAARLFLAACACPFAIEAQEEYGIGPTPSWVTSLSPDVDRPLRGGVVTGGSELLLLDRQDRVGPTLERFFHVARRLVDEAAVQRGSQIEVSFDPTYQDLVLHTMRVMRGGESVNQLPLARFQVVQRETRAEYQIYDGSKSVMVVLPDVRPGDVLEYSYTLRGSNPVYEDRYVAFFTGQLDVPIDLVHFRVLWPEDRRLFLRADDGMPEPTVRETGGYIEYVWERADVTPRPVDADLPVWFNPLPRVQLSDFPGWREVATWGRSLFDLTQPLPSEVETWLADLRSRETSAAEQALAALRFVQDEVRYLGIELGVNSHVPYPPVTVMQRRYGDCKDKSLLLIAMLRELGIVARAALVSTVYGEHLDDFHPTPTVFDHAIVRARVDDGWYFMDPTMLHQRGDLEEIAPQFGSALVLDEGVDSLITMPPPRASGPSVEIRASFDLSAVDSAVVTQIRTVYRAAAATAMRYTFQNNSIEQLQQSYEEYYAELYPSIESTSALQVEDDEDANVVRTIESYSVPEFWDRREGSEERVGEFYPLELSNAIASPTTVNRTMPLGIAHPVHIKYTINATLADGWSITPEVEDLDTDAARFQYRAAAEEDVLTLSWEYETLADHVTPESSGDHIRTMERAAEFLGYSFVVGSEPGTLGLHPQEFNWLVLFMAMSIAGAAGWGSLRIYRLRPSWPHEPPTTTDGPHGIGGWLILLAIGVTISPLITLVDLADTLPSYAVSTWSALTTPGSAAYHPAWAPALIFELSANVALLALAIVQVLAFYRRKMVFPALFIGLSLFRIATTWVDAEISNLIPAVVEASGPIPSFEPTIVGTMVWLLYVYRSKRVQNTFVN